MAKAKKRLNAAAAPYAAQTNSAITIKKDIGDFTIIPFEQRGNKCH